MANLLEGLRTTFGRTTLFIAHDLGVVEHACDQVVVMYRGTVMEIADADVVYAHPAHSLHAGAVGRAGARSRAAACPRGPQRPRHGVNR